MLYKSYAKANIFLDVVSIYKNGFHGIKSIFTETNIFDEINYEITDSGKIEVKDNSSLLPDDNLLTKAYDVFFKNVGREKIGLDITIEKKIPIGGGMGGGSSNAASVLKILNKHCKANLSHYELERLASLIGSDVPFFIKSGVQKVCGRGELLFPVKSGLKELKGIAVFPELKIPTPYAYKLIDEGGYEKQTYEGRKKYNDILNGIITGNKKLIIDSLYNKFEYPIYKSFPELHKIKNEILDSGMDNAVMSGSGSTILGFANNEEFFNKSIDILSQKGYKTEIISCRF